MCAHYDTMWAIYLVGVGFCNCLLPSIAWGLWITLHHKSDLVVYFCVAASIVTLLNDLWFTANVSRRMRMSADRMSERVRKVRVGVATAITVIGAMVGWVVWNVALLSDCSDSMDKNTKLIVSGVSAFCFYMFFGTAVHVRVMMGALRWIKFIVLFVGTEMKCVSILQGLDTAWLLFAVLTAAESLAMADDHYSLARLDQVREREIAHV